MEIIRKESGLTLLEAMIAVMVLTLGILGVASMQTKAVQGNIFAGRLTERSTVAEDKMEALMDLDYNHADLSDATAVGTFTTHTDPNPPEGYTITWDVDDNVPLNNTKTIRVTATWHDQRRQPVTLMFIKPN